MKESNKDLLNGQSNVENISSSESSELVKREEVEGTPFIVVEKDSGVDIVMGRYIIKGGLRSKEEAMKAIESKRWELIMAVIGIYVEEYVKIKEGETV